jgi:hypothetical protein
MTDAAQAATLAQLLSRAEQLANQPTWFTVDGRAQHQREQDFHWLLDIRDTVRALVHCVRVRVVPDAGPEPSQAAIEAARQVVFDACARGDLRGAYGYLDIDAAVRAAYAVDGVRAPVPPDVTPIAILCPYCERPFDWIPLRNAAPEPLREAATELVKAIYARFGHEASGQSFHPLVKLAMDVSAALASSSTTTENPQRPSRPD